MERLIGFDLQMIHDSVLMGINIFILFFGLSYLLFNPTRDFLKKRQDKIAEELKSAADNEQESARLRKEYEDKLKNVEKEAEAILEDARKKAKIRENEIIQEAKEEAFRIIERANKETELASKKAADELKTEVVNIAALMAQKAVRASVDLKIQEELIENTLKEIGESTWQS